MPPILSLPEYAVFPVWLEFSGLPESLHAVRKNAWSGFRKLVELDCCMNPAAPGLAKCAASAVGRRCGFDGDAMLKIATGLRRQRLIRAFIPAHPDEELLYEIAVPLRVPRLFDEIRADMEVSVGPAAARAPWRYAHQEPGAARDEDTHRAVVDLYLNHLSTALNATTVDELAVLADRYPLPAIQQAFELAAARGQRHLSGIFTFLRHRRE